MFKFFDSVGNIFSTVVDFVIGTFKMLLNLVKLIFRAQAFLIEVIGHLPPFLVVFMLVTVSVAILFQILNKGS